MIGMVKLASALIVGNTFIWKPSPYSPYTALKLGELAARIFPKGVVNVLSGEEDLGPMLTAHPGVAKVSFTGSVGTGKKVMQACATTLKRVTLELGGNDAAIVYPDVNIAEVVPKVRDILPKRQGPFPDANSTLSACTPSLHPYWSGMLLHQAPVRA